MSYLKDFKTHIVNKDYPELLKIWEEYCAGDELDTEEVCEILKMIKMSSLAGPFGRHVERILPLWEMLPKGQPAHDVLKLIVDLSTSESESLFELVKNYIYEKYGSEKDFAEKLRLIGFKGKDKTQGSISSYDLLSHLEKGNHVFHQGGWGVGEILDVSFLREQITLEFDYVPGRKELSFATAFKTLVPIPDTHFLAKRFGMPDALESQAKEDPTAVIHMLLKDLGPKNALEIKDELCELVIPTKEWAKWWQATRSKLKKDTLILTPSNLKEPFVLRKEGVPHEDRLKKALEGSLSPEKLVHTLHTFSRDFPETLKHADIKTVALSKLQESLSQSELPPHILLELLFLKETLTNSSEEETVRSLIQGASSLHHLIDLMSVLQFKKKMLTEIKKHKPDWKEIFLDLLFKLPQGNLKDYLLAEILSAKAEDTLKTKLCSIYTHPGTNPETFLWYFQKLKADKKLPFNDREGKVRFFEGLLILLCTIEHTAGAKDLVKKIHNLLSSGRFALVRQIMQMASREEVQEFLLLASKCHSLDDHDQKIFRSLAEVVYPELSKGKKQDDEEESSIIWTTKEGYEKIKVRVEQIATVEAVANAQEIEVARAHGDLRENAEFKAALEKRDRLQSELKTLSDQLKHARILTAHDISTESVGVGTVVECVTKQGKPITYTLLGPWDADPEKHILSFQSKLAQTMKGKAVGATVAVGEDELKIVSIRSYI